MEAEHPLLLRLRVTRIDLARTADHGTTDHMGTFHRRSTDPGRIDVPGTELIMEQLLITEHIDLATFVDSTATSCKSKRILGTVDTVARVSTTRVHTSGNKRRHTVLVTYAWNRLI